MPKDTTIKATRKGCENSLTRKCWLFSRMRKARWCSSCSASARRYASCCANAITISDAGHIPWSCTSSAGMSWHVLKKDARLRARLCVYQCSSFLHTAFMLFQLEKEAPTSLAFFIGLLLLHLSLPLSLVYQRHTEMRVSALQPV
jgi:hypothetical protein